MMQHIKAIFLAGVLLLTLHSANLDISGQKALFGMGVMAETPPACGATCYRGNMKPYPCTGDKCPPCWYQEPDNSYSCYEYEPNTDKRCPSFPHPVTPPASGCTAGGGGSSKCYRGNMKRYPCEGCVRCPPCWYREADGTFSCFEYESAADKKCPTFPNPTNCNGTTNARA